MRFGDRFVEIRVEPVFALLDSVELTNDNVGASVTVSGSRNTAGVKITPQYGSAAGSFSEGNVMA